MAVDTADKRRSIRNLGVPHLREPSAPDGSINRMHMLALYTGIDAAAAASEGGAFHLVGHETGYEHTPVSPGVALRWDETNGWVYATTGRVHPATDYAPLILPGVNKFGSTPVTINNAAGKILHAALEQNSATTGQALVWSGTAWGPGAVSGMGDVVGPSSATDNAIARFDGATGKLIQNTSLVTISDAGVMSGVGALLSGLTASRLMASDSSKNLVSVSALTSWIAATANETTVADDGDGSVTIGLVDSPIVLGLSINNTSANSILNLSTNASQLRLINYETAGSDRWYVGANATAESGSNAGSDFWFRGLADDGSTILHTAVVTRSTGLWAFPADVTVGDDLTVTGEALVSGRLAIGADDASYDLNLQKSTAGILRGRVYNTSADAAAAGFFLVRTDGGADVQYNFQIGAGVAWSMGLDNSDSDKWKLCGNASIGTTTVLTCDTSGNLVVAGDVSVGDDLTVTGDVSVGALFTRTQGSATLSSDAFTVAYSTTFLTSQSGTSDDCATINGGANGMRLTLIATTGHTITVKHGTGNIRLDGSADKVLNSIYDRLELEYEIVAGWCQIAFSNNG